MAHLFPCDSFLLEHMKDLFKKLVYMYILKYLFVWLHQVLAGSHGIFGCGAQILVGI